MCCEVMDSYGLPMEVYGATPLEAWLKQWKYVGCNGHSLQNINSKSCGHYALFFSQSPSERLYHVRFFESVFKTRLFDEWPCRGSNVKIVDCKRKRVARRL